MAKWLDLSNYRVKATLHEESYVGWAWISEGQWKSGKPLVLRVKESRGSKARLVCRTIDYNFRGYYKAEMKNRYGRKAKALEEGELYLLLPKHYRDQLKLDGEITTFDGIQVMGLQAKHPHPFMALGTGWLASLKHVDPYVRVGTWLATLSLLLGVVGLAFLFV